MFDSYDPRWSEDRDHEDERRPGIRVGGDWPGGRDPDPHGVFVRQLDLPRDRLTAMQGPTVLRGGR